MFLLLIVAGGLVLYDFEGRPKATPAPTVTGPTGVATGGPGIVPTPTTVHTGTGTFAFAAASGPVVGQGGEVETYRVAVENGIGVDAEAFGYAVESILSDSRSWIAEGTVRLQRVPGSSPSAFVVYLASPVTSQSLCREDGLETDQYTSCRLGDNRVIINSARWLTGITGYGAPLDVYQAYAINHEVGHQLGHGHEGCPAPGAPAPVMQQQTYGLQGCRANGWPMVNGAIYSGPPAEA